MQEDQTEHPDIWRELEKGSISVTKNTIPLVSIGGDHLFKQVNQLMKVHSGIIGIPSKTNARQRLFLTASELSNFAR